MFSCVDIDLILDFLYNTRYSGCSEFHKILFSGSQFFIMHKDAPHLDGQYAAFGCVMDGMDVVDRIANQPRNMMTNKPKKDQVMAKVTVDTQGVTYPEPEKLADPFGR